MKAMILAAGRGKRFAPLTDTCPKPLIPVMGKPLIVYHIEALKKAGFNEIVINVSHLKEQIVQKLGDGSQWGVTIQYSVEETALETAGGIRKALPLLGSAPFLIVSADIYTDYPFQMLKVQPSKKVHLVLVPNPPHRAEGDFCLQDKQVFRRDLSKPSLTYGNIAVIHPSLFDQVQSEILPLAPLLHQAVYAQEVTGEHYSGVWHDIGTIERLQALEKSLHPKPLQNIKV